MHLSTSIVLSLLTISSSVIGSPDLAGPVEDIVKILRGPCRSEAAPFCSAYLHYPITKTVTRTVTATKPGSTVVTTLPDQTSRQTTKVTTTNIVTSTEEVQQDDPTVTSTNTVTAGTRTVYQKRAAPTIPARIRKYPPRYISSACRRVIPRSTTTKTTTKTVSVAGVASTSTAPGKTTTVTDTQTIQETSSVIATTTIPPTNTDTQVVQTTVTPILVKPKICNAQGLPGANAFNYDANFNTNQADCIASCKTDNRCLSTGFYIVTNPTTGTQTGTCRKYDKSVTDSADLGSGYYNFNDKAC